MSTEATSQQVQRPSYLQHTVEVGSSVSYMILGSLLAVGVLGSGGMLLTAVGVALFAIGVFKLVAYGRRPQEMQTPTSVVTGTGVTAVGDVLSLLLQALRQQRQCAEVETQKKNQKAQEKYQRLENEFDQTDIREAVEDWNLFPSTDPTREINKAPVAVQQPKVPAKVPSVVPTPTAVVTQPSPKQVSQEDVDRIEHILKTLSETYLCFLLAKEKELRAIGEKLEKRVHPLQFLEVIFSTPKLRERMMIIADSTILFSRWKTEQSEKLKNRSGESSQYVAHFTQTLKDALGLTAGQIMELEGCVATSDVAAGEKLINKLVLWSAEFNKKK